MVKGGSETCQVPRLIAKVERHCVIAFACFAFGRYRQRRANSTASTMAPPCSRLACCVARRSPALTLGFARLAASSLPHRLGKRLRVEVCRFEPARHRKVDMSTLIQRGASHETMPTVTFVPARTVTCNSNGLANLSGTVPRDKPTFPALEFGSNPQSQTRRTP